MILPDYVRFALDRLNTRGFEGYLVGGCVRDSLLGKEPLDYDIAVSSAPEQTKQCFSDCRVIETGIKHGTVTVMVDSHPLELTTFRLDGEYGDNRHPKNVTFSPHLSEDLSRRDFTVNAMAYSPHKGLIDLFGGENDLQNGIIRCVGTPETRFTEDALRIMRCVRFASVLGFRVEKNTEKAVFGCAGLLKNISAERIYTELKKLLWGKNAKEVLIRYRRVFETVLPPIKEVSETDYSFSAENMEKAGSTEEKLTLFLHSLGTSGAERVLLSLKAENRQRKATRFLLENRAVEFASLGEAKRFIGEHGEQAVSGLVSFKEIIAPHTSELLKQALSDVSRHNACVKISQLALNGNDLAAMGYSGKEIGEILQRLLIEVTEGRAENTRQALALAVVSC